MSQNLISQTMTDVQRDAMLADLTAFETKFVNYKCVLTAEQIKRLSRLAASDIALLEMALTYAQQNPTAIPANIDVAELAKDVALAKQLVKVEAKAEQQADYSRTSRIAVMSDGYVAARLIYRVAQAQGSTPETATFLEAFGARFAHGPSPTPAPPA